MNHFWSSYMLVLFLLCSFPHANANVVLNQSYENFEGTDWSTSLGVNSSGGQVFGIDAADGISYVRFTVGANSGGSFSFGQVRGQRIDASNITLDRISATQQVRGETAGYIVYQIAPNPWI